MPAPRHAADKPACSMTDGDTNCMQASMPGSRAGRYVNAVIAAETAAFVGAQKIPTTHNS